LSSYAWRHCVDASRVGRIGAADSTIIAFKGESIMSVLRHLFAVVVATLVSAPAWAIPTGNLVTNPGFETPEVIGTQHPSTFGDWSHDGATIVGGENGITPRTGQGMLRFDFTSSAGPTVLRDGANIYQLIDVSPYAALIASGQAVAHADYFVNRVLGDSLTDTRFDLAIGAYSGLPGDFPAVVESPLASVLVMFFSDGDPQSWEQLQASLSLPVGTSFLSIAISAVENVSNDGVNEFDGHYADDVTLYLDRRATATSAVPEPAILGLAVILGLLTMLCRRRGGHAGV